jgi:2,3-bisphosphoglycerate-dependent phosphoglycerate mutase
MRIYFIRHAQSENNALWARTGNSDGRSPDPLLTPAGQEQARHLAEFLARPESAAETDMWDVLDRRGFTISHLYTSLMQRSVLTGTVLAQALNLPLQAWPDLHEVGGIYQDVPDGEERMGLPGPNRAFFESEYPRLLLPDTLGDEGWWNRPYESREQIRQRARRVAGELFDRHGGSEDHVALVTHGAFGYVLLSALLDRRETQDDAPDPRRLWLLMNNTGITRLDYTSRYATLVYLNRLDHLPPDLITD